MKNNEQKANHKEQITHKKQHKSKTTQTHTYVIASPLLAKKRHCHKYHCYAFRQNVDDAGDLRLTEIAS